MIKRELVPNAFLAKRPEVLRKRLVLRRSSNDRSANVYTLPVPASAIMAFGARGVSPAHQGNLRNSIDFYVPEGTPVLAAAGGVVFATRDDSNVHGISTRYWDLGNWIDIKHSRNEYTWYEHLAYKKIRVRAGQHVKKGQVIALSGNTGFTKNPHLHFQVNRYFGTGLDDYVTLRARFEKRFGFVQKVYAGARRAGITGN